ncbi:MAG TPA: BON domain-containing protein [Gemmatimonadaceae bacterium]|nr:BON domain-containing protein [Gemmatimonadaceae bacterium]
MDEMMGSNRPTNAMTLLAGVGIGAALMYILDPARGKRRRALARDKARSAINTAERELKERGEDLRNRARGAAAELRNAGDDHPSDEQLVARVRSELGHSVEHARAIEVTAEQGRVTLRGPVLSSELSEVLATARKVRGVEAVENQLEVHSRPGSVTALQ